MIYKNVIVITDNHYLYSQFKEIIDRLQIENVNFQYRCTSTKLERKQDNLYRIDVKNEYNKIIDTYDLVISIHCKQIFPCELVKAVKCINIHPGLNPYNRGWYPQVFSIINKLPAGATIHEMDELIDHGKIIDQQEVLINTWDTSLDVYNKVLHVELSLLEKNILLILSNSYKTVEPKMEGNYNSISDFNKLQEIDLHENLTALEFIDRLRALTHGEFKNAYYRDPITQRKIFLRLKLDLE